MPAALPPLRPPDNCVMSTPPKPIEVVVVTVVAAGTPSVVPVPNSETLLVGLANPTPVFKPNPTEDGAEVVVVCPKPENREGVEVVVEAGVSEDVENEGNRVDVPVLPVPPVPVPKIFEVPVEVDAKVPNGAVVGALVVVAPKENPPLGFKLDGGAPKILLIVGTNM